MTDASVSETCCRRRASTLSSRLGVLSVLIWSISVTADAQERGRVFAGGLLGVSALSADGRSVSMGSEAALSLYKPENGIAMNLFAGVHVREYFSVQADWMWNRNDVTLVSSFVTPQGGGFYELRRHSHQHAAVLDGLVYFRRRDSAVRPYLGTGLSVLRLVSEDVVTAVSHGLLAPTADIAATRVGLRSHVGIDVRISRRLSFRYSFSETISSNPISPLLLPSGERRLANFQNLFGFVGTF